MTSGLDDYMVISIKRKKNETELKIPGARVQVEVSGKKMWLWIDSASPVTIFSINDLKTTLGKANIQLQSSKEGLQQQPNKHTRECNSDDVIKWLGSTSTGVSNIRKSSINRRARPDWDPRSRASPTEESDGNHRGRDQSREGGIRRIANILL